MTLDPQRLFDALQNSGLKHFTGVPCSSLDPLTTAAHGTGRYVAASVEGEAVALAAGPPPAGGPAGGPPPHAGPGHPGNPVGSPRVRLRRPGLPHCLVVEGPGP